MTSMARVQGQSEGSPRARSEADRRALVLVIHHEEKGFAVPSGIDETTCEVVQVFPNAKLPDDVLALGRVPDLLVVPIGDGSARGLAVAGRLHAAAPLAAVPILAVAPARRMTAKHGQLRDVGIVGVVDPEASADHVLFRIEQLVRPRNRRRHWERAAVLLPVEIEGAGGRSQEIAVDLSIGGLRVLSARPIETNCDVLLRFRLAHADAELCLSGRVVRSATDPRTLPSHSLGIVFYPASDEDVALLELEVGLLLAR